MAMNTLVSHRVGCRASRRERRGISAILTILVMLVLIAFIVLGVDIGRGYLTQTELQVAADASARATVWEVPKLDFAAASQVAVHMAAANSADGQSVALDLAGNDVEYGIWRPASRTFEVLSGDARVSANAVRVTPRRWATRGNPMQLYFGPILGMDTMDVTASATAFLRGYSNGRALGLIGLDFIDLNGISMIDSYLPANGPYSPETARSNGTVMTNGDITGNGTIDIHGDAYPGPSPDDTIGLVGQADITGYQKPLDEEMVFNPEPAPTSYNNSAIQQYLDSKRNLVLRGQESVVIPGGTAANPNVYYVNDFIMTGNTTVTVSGPVKFYVSGKVDLTGSVSVNEGLPANFQVSVLGAGPVELGGGSEQFAQVYAPLAPVKIHGTQSTFGFFGAVIGKSLTVTGNSAIHYDESGPGWSIREPYRVELVR